MKYFKKLFNRNNYHYTNKKGLSAGSMGTIANPPLISVVMPVCNGPPVWLRCAINSVLEQSYTNWELCIVDDASTNKNTIKTLAGIQDARVHIRHLLQNQGISSATNEALSGSKGEYVTFLDQDDELTKDALSDIANVIVRNNPDLIYSDEDKFTDTLFGKRYLDAHFKPDYSPDLLLSHNYITHLMVIRRDLLQNIGLFHKEFDGAQDYDLVLRAVEHAEKICHIRNVLYHWRYHSGSASHSAESRAKCNDAGKRAVEAALERRSIHAIVEPTTLCNHYRVRRSVKGIPLVSIIIPFCNNHELLEVCLSSITSKTTYPSYEVLVISNGSSTGITSDCIKKWTRTNQRAHFFEYNIPTNYPDINNYAAGISNGEYLVFMRNYIGIITPGWIEALLEHAQRAEIGAVGGRIFTPDTSVHDAGIVIEKNDYAGHPHRGAPKEAGGYFHRLMLTRNVSSLTCDMMMVSKEKFNGIGGMDASNLPGSLYDVDFCLRLMEKGFWNVYTPYCEAVYNGTLSGMDDHSPGEKTRFRNEITYFSGRHKKILKTRDPFFNPHLILIHNDIRYNPHPLTDHPVGCYRRNYQTD
jgi:glycosyltransferase involved in cell wall biosynthesis